MAQHPVIASALALGALAVQRQPNKWMKPVKASGKFREGLRERIAPSNMRHLVEQHNLQPFRRPLEGTGRQDHRGP